LENERKELEQEMAEPDFWNDLERSTRVNQRMKHVSDKLAHVASLRKRVNDTEALIELVEEESDASLVPEVLGEVQAIAADVETLRLETLLRGTYDAGNAILSLHAGAGGTEAQDWTQMLHRMYLRYCERKGYGVKLLDLLPGDEAGTKSATWEVSGENAYGFLRSEKGVHRLVRISPFDSSARRHTSFASLDVSPIIEDSAFVLNMEEVRIDTYRASGAGGQHVNRTDSAVRITHIPTGLVVTSQDQRSQIQNREKAMRVLRARLYDMQRAQATGDYASTRKSQVGTGDRSERIRTYNFPQGRVTDHRINLTLYQLENFVSGDCDSVIDALILQDQTERLENLRE